MTESISSQSKLALILAALPKLLKSIAHLLKDVVPLFTK